MNTLIRELSQQKNLQSFLTKVLDYMVRYFKTISLQSQQRTFNNINKICEKLQSLYQYQYSLSSLAKKLILNIQTKLKDKQQQQNQQFPTIKKKYQHSGMKSFINNIQSTIQYDINNNNNNNNNNIQELSSQLLQLSQAPTRLPSTESDFQYIRKAVIQELELLKDDILQADDRLRDNIQNILGKNVNKHINKKYVLIIQSFINNQTIIEKVEELGWQPIIVKNQKNIINKQANQQNKQAQAKQKKQSAKQPIKQPTKQPTKQIQISEISSYLHICHSSIISSDSITKTGGLLCPSGSLMLAIMCYHRKVPVIGLSRNYCLSDKIILSQRALVNSVNPLEFFDIKFDDFGTYITKNYDYVDAKYVSLIVTERGSWVREEIDKVQEEYWSY